MTSVGELRLRIPEHLACLEGHFPGPSVVPGVAVIDWAEHDARHHFRGTDEVHDRERIKFNRLVHPGQALLPRLVHDDVRHGIGYRFRSSDGGDEFASGRLCFAEPGRS